MINEIKRVIDNYLNNKLMAAVIVGTYTGAEIAVNEKFKIPVSQVSGNLVGRLRNGDKVRLLAPTGWDEYFILEVIGRPFRFLDEG